MSTESTGNWLINWLSSRYPPSPGPFLFFRGRSLQENALDDVFGSAKVATVELMTHPVSPTEYAYLTSGEHADRLEQVKTSSFASAQLRATKCAAT